MLSKSKGVILRVAASFHVLFGMVSPEKDIGGTITDEAVLAAIGFVELCCQQTAFMAGRGQISEDIEMIRASKPTSVYTKIALYSRIQFSSG